MLKASALQPFQKNNSLKRLGTEVEIYFRAGIWTCISCFWVDYSWTTCFLVEWIFISLLQTERAETGRNNTDEYCIAHEITKEYFQKMRDFRLNSLSDSVREWTWTWERVWVWLLSCKSNYWHSLNSNLECIPSLTAAAFCLPFR